VKGEMMWMQFVTKVCARCKKEKDVGEFATDNKARDGYQSYCKDCQRQVYREWKEKNRQRYREGALKWYYRHKQEVINYQRKYRKDRKKLAVHSIRKHHPEKQPLANICEFCGINEGLIRHHPEYDMPEVYVTCCRRCHWWIHKGVS